MHSAGNAILTAAAVLAIAAAAWFILGGPSGVFAAKAPVYTGLVSGVGAGGYDPVAYFTSGKAEKGDPAITAEYAGVTWRFSSAANRDLFTANPEAYAPQYGGYCAYAVAHGYTAKGDPEAWTIHGGKLYLNYNLPTRGEWLKSVDDFIKKGNANWPGVLGK